MIAKSIDKKNAIKEFDFSEEYQSSNKGLSIPIGFDENDQLAIEDFSKFQHILVSGVTGSGKTSYVQTLIASLIKTNSPEDIKFIIADSKRVDYNFMKNSPYLFCPLINDNYEFNSTIRKIYNDINSPSSRSAIKRRLENNNNFNLFIIVDDIGLFNREIDDNVVLACLAQEARINHIHIIFVTSTPNTSVIPNEIKANISCRIAFNVASKQISKMIIDDYGAEKLKCPGELIFKYGSQIKKLSIPFIDYSELNDMIESATENSATLDNFSNLAMKAFGTSKDLDIYKNNSLYSDSLYKDVVNFVVAQQKASTSLIQRRFGIGYNRAAKLIDTLEENGIIGPANGAKPRDVFIKNNSVENNEDFKNTNYNVKELNNENNVLNSDNPPEIHLRYYKYTKVLDGSFSVSSDKVHLEKKIDLGFNTATASPTFDGNTIEGIVLKKPSLFNRVGYFCIKIKKSTKATASGTAKEYIDSNNLDKYTTLEFDKSCLNDVKAFLTQLSEDTHISIIEE